MHRKVLEGGREIVKYNYLWDVGWGEETFIFHFIYSAVHSENFYRDVDGFILK